MSWPRIPPLTYCRECGRPHRAWTPGALCNEHARAVLNRQGESFRETRKRLQSAEGKGVTPETGAAEASPARRSA